MRIDGTSKWMCVGKQLSSEADLNKWANLVYTFMILLVSTAIKLRH